MEYLSPQDITYIYWIILFCAFYAVFVGIFVSHVSLEYYWKARHIFSDIVLDNLMYAESKSYTDGFNITDKFFEDEKRIIKHIVKEGELDLSKVMSQEDFEVVRPHLKQTVWEW